MPVTNRFQRREIAKRIIDRAEYRIEIDSPEAGTKPVTGAELVIDHDRLFDILEAELTVSGFTIYSAEAMDAYREEVERDTRKRIAAYLEIVREMTAGKISPFMTEALHTVSRGVAYWNLQDVDPALLVEARPMTVREAFAAAGHPASGEFITTHYRLAKWYWTTGTGEERTHEWNTRMPDGWTEFELGSIGDTEPNLANLPAVDVLNLLPEVVRMVVPL